MNGEEKKKAIWCAKLVLTLCLLGFILYKVNWRDLFDSLALIRTELIVMWFLLVVINVVLSSLKWMMLLTPFEARLSLLDAVRLYFITIFFNNFLPGSIGGDGYRGYQVYKSEGSISAAYFPIFMERVSGLMVLVLLGGIAGSLLYVHQRDFVSLIIALSGFGATAAIMGFFCLAIYSKKILSLKFFSNKKRIHALAGKLSRNILIYKKYPKVILWTGFFTLLFYFLLFYARFLLLIATDGYVSFVVVVGVIMVSNVLAMLPVSLNGYGILDFSFIGLLSYYGVDYEKAVLVMLLYRCMQVMISAFGGLLYVFSGDREVVKEKMDTKSKIVARKREPERMGIRV